MPGLAGAGLSNVRFGSLADILLNSRRLPFPLALGDLDDPRIKKQAARAACIDRSCRKLSAYVSDALLGICFGRGHWLRRQLKHRCFLTLTQFCQENNAPIRKFERIMVLHRLVLIHLSEDCRSVR